MLHKDAGQTSATFIGEWLLIDVEPERVITGRNTNRKDVLQPDSSAAQTFSHSWIKGHTYFFTNDGEVIIKNENGKEYSRMKYSVKNDIIFFDNEGARQAVQILKLKGRKMHFRTNAVADVTVNKEYYCKFIKMNN